MCSQQYHEDQALEYYCEECKVCICHKCSVVSHNRHTMVDMQKAADEQKMQITDAIEKVKAEVVIYENQMKEETELMDKSKLEISAARRKMTQTVDDCIRILTEHKSAMNEMFDEINAEQHKAHATHLETLQFAATQLKSSVDQGEKILERNINAEILGTKQVIIGRCQELLNTKKPEIYKPPHVNYVVENKMDILDRVVVNNTDPSLSLVDGQFEKEIEQMTETGFTIVTRDSGGIHCYNEDDHIKVDLQTPSGDKLKTEIKDSKDGKYTVTYTPEYVGQYEVGIEMNGQALTGSSRSVQVVPHHYQFVFKFGSHGNGPGQFSFPLHIVVSKKTGTIAVADCKNERIQLFSPDGIFLREIALKKDLFTVAFTRSGDVIAVVPADGHKISLFTESGQFIKHVNDEHFQTPYHVFVASDDRIGTCDWANNEIRIISPDGSRLLQSFHASDFDKSLWSAVYHQDTFFVCDRVAHRIKVFNKEGKFLYNIGSEGSGDGQLRNPFGLAVDKFNNLIVCDAGNRRLQLFTLDGKFVSKIEQHFVEDGGLPVYVAVSNDGRVFVTGGVKHCVYVFQ